VSSAIPPPRGSRAAFLLGSCYSFPERDEENFQAIDPRRSIATLKHRCVELAEPIHFRN
jgi:hypothetical protein